MKVLSIAVLLGALLVATPVDAMHSHTRRTQELDASGDAPLEPSSADTPVEADVPVDVEEPENECGNTGYLTVHVLDNAHGTPAAGMKILLKRVTPEETAGPLKEFTTNSDGRIDGRALTGCEFQEGIYEWTFFVSDYYKSKDTCLTEDSVPFLGEVPVRFGITNEDEHYHVPLLVSPYSYTTYRGS